MNWNEHYNLKDKHSFLSASNYHWVNYEGDKLAETFRRDAAKKRGTILHAFAADCIRLKQKLPRSRKTLNLYVNDCIGYDMRPEQLLYYSDNAFGTADAISFRKGVLRIHDLKTGVTKPSMTQLLIYTSYFCLEYGVKPADIEINLALYYQNEVLCHQPEVDEILPIMDKIVVFNNIIEEIKNEEGI